MIAKRKDSIYEPGERSDDWVRFKLERQQEYVVGGYRSGGSASTRCWLATTRVAGCDLPEKVRAGFVPRVRLELLGKLEPL
jgi:hypothetical protein